MRCMNMRNKKSRLTDRMAIVTFGDNKGNFVSGVLSGVGYYAIIRNATWWVENVDSIYEWLEESGIDTRYKHEGMVLTFECKEDLAMFLLRWA